MILSQTDGNRAIASGSGGFSVLLRAEKTESFVVFGDSVLRAADWLGDDERDDESDAELMLIIFHRLLERSRARAVLRLL